VFARFSDLGSVRRVWLWLRSEGLSFPLQAHYGSSIRWIDPSYIAIYHVLTNPVYAGAYAYGKSRCEVTLDRSGARKKRMRKLPQSQWAVLIPNHHQGFIDWSTYEANRIRISANTHPQPHQSGGGAMREGTALLQGLAVCGHCGRKLSTHYTGRTASPGYHCAGKRIVNERGLYCLNVGAIQIDDAVAQAVLTALAPLGIEAAISAAERIEVGRWRSGASRWSAQAMRRSVPSAVIAPSILTIVWSPVASKPNGRSRCANWRPRKQNWRSANNAVPERSALTSEIACSLSAPICGRYGRRRPRRHATRRSCYEPCSKRSSLPSTRMNIVRT
jgi:hypothetical protein